MDKITHCTQCNKSISYSTKRPKLCGECKKGKPKVYRKARTIPTRSKNEAKMQYLLNAILPEADYIDNGYYSWLPSPKNHPMQVDRLYPKLKLAFEYNGAQHYEFNAFMHKTQADFEYLQRCDKLKAKLMKQMGYALISIRYDKKLTKGYLVRRLREEGLLEGLKRKTKVVDTYEEE